MRRQIHSFALAMTLLVGGSMTLPWAPAAAQQFDLGTVQLLSGSVIPGTAPATNESLYFDPNGTHALTLTVPNDIYNQSGFRVVPAGSQIQGTLRPAQGGALFTAEALVINGRRLPLQGSTGLINDEKDPRQYDTESTVEDAVIGGVAGALIGGLTGGVSAIGVLGGAATGVGVGNITAPQVVVLRPNQVLNLTLSAPLRF